MSRLRRSPLRGLGSLPGISNLCGLSRLCGWPMWLLLAAAMLYGHTAYLYGKAQLAQWLIADAWQLSLSQQQPVRPWAWADTWPVARLQYQAGDQPQDLYVLAGATGNSLAFGPGHMTGTSLPGKNGNSIIGGHRDTHFAFLQDLQRGDILRVQNQLGEWRRYEVSQIRVRNIDHGPLQLDPRLHELQLITCYPFDALHTGGPLRYQVSLRPVLAAPTTYASTF